MTSDIKPPARIIEDRRNSLNKLQGRVVEGEVAAVVGVDASSRQIGTVQGDSTRRGERHD